MPSPTIICEFCSTEMRRNTYAVHVKAKHVKEIGQLLFEDMKESNFSTIQSYASSLNANTLMIESKIHPDAEYWFGEQPFFYQRTSAPIQDKYGEPVIKQKKYPEDVEKTAYLKCEKNLEAHRAFLEEALSTISLLDYIKMGKELRIKNTEERMVRSELRALKETHEALIESTNREIALLKKEAEMWKETCEEQELIKPLKDENAFMRVKVNRLNNELIALKQRWDEREQEWIDKMTENNQSRHQEMSKLMEYEEELKQKLMKEQETNEKLHVRVKKEAQKILDKKKEQKKKAKKALKKAKRLAELSSDSDSDSSSSSDSDSD